MRKLSTAIVNAADRTTDVLADLHLIWQDAMITERLLASGSLTFHIPGSDASAVAQVYDNGQVIRLSYEDGGAPDEFFVTIVNWQDGETSRLAITAEILWRILSRTLIKDTLAATGTVRRRFPVPNQTPATALTKIMASAPAPFVAGTVSGLSSAQQAALVSLQIENTTHLAGITALCEAITTATGETCEWVATYRSGTDDYQIDLVTQIGIAGNRTVKADPTDPATSNRLQIAKRTDTTQYAGRLIPYITQDDTQVGIGAAAFTATNVAGQVLTIGADVVPYDDFGVSELYLGNDARGFHAITDASQPAGTVTVGSGTFSIGDVVRFAVDSSGTQLDYLDIESANYGLAEKPQAFEGTAFANLLRDAGVDDTCQSQTGWNAVGTPTITLISDERYTEIGSQSLQVACGIGEGIESDSITTTEAYLWFWVYMSLTSGAIKVEVIDNNGASYKPAEASSLLLEGLEGGAIRDFASPVRLRITATQAATTFILDAAVLAPTGTQAVQWRDVMGPADLWKAAVKEIRKEAGTAYTSYTARWVPLRHVLGAGWDFAELGAIYALKDGYDGTSLRTNITTRLVELKRSLTDPTWEAEGQFERVQPDLLTRLIPSQAKSVTLNPSLNVREPVPATVGSITPSNGLGWTKASGGGAWSPAQNTTDLLCEFRQNEAVVASETVRVTLTPGAGTMAAALEGADSPDITFAVQGGGTAALTVVFTHVASGVKASVSLSAVQGGADGEPGADAVIENGSIVAAYLANEAARITVDDLNFRPTAHNGIAWDAGSFRLSNDPATSRTINAGTHTITGTRAYLYLDLSSLGPTNALVATGTFSDVAGNANRVLIAVAWKNPEATERASVVTVYGQVYLSSMFIDVAFLSALTASIGNLTINGGSLALMDGTEVRGCWDDTGMYLVAKQGLSFGNAIQSLVFKRLVSTDPDVYETIGFIGGWWSGSGRNVVLGADVGDLLINVFGKMALQSGDFEVSENASIGGNLNVGGSLTEGGTDVALTTDLHSHSNIGVLDAISSAGSGSIITSAERTKLAGIEAGAEVNDHSHSNLAVLDAITDAGRGYLITATETNNILSNTVNRHSHPGTETVIETASLNVTKEPGTGYVTDVVLNKTTVSVAQPAA